MFYKNDYSVIRKCDKCVKNVNLFRLILSNKTLPRDKSGYMRLDKPDLSPVGCDCKGESAIFEPPRFFCWGKCRHLDDALL